MRGRLSAYSVVFMRCSCDIRLTTRLLLEQGLVLVPLVSHIVAMTFRGGGRSPLARRVKVSLVSEALYSEQVEPFLKYQTLAVHRCNRCSPQCAVNRGPTVLLSRASSKARRALVIGMAWFVSRLSFVPRRPKTARLGTVKSSIDIDEEGAQQITL